MDIEAKTNRDQRTEEDMEILRTWLRKQPHMPQDIDDELLVPFICGTKSIEKAKRKLESFCMLHSKYPDNFSFPFRDPSDPVFHAFCEWGKMFVLPKTTPEGYRVFFGICEDFDKHDGFKSNVIMSMILETDMILHPDCPGLVLAFDCRRIDARIMTKMGLASVTFFLQYLESIPMKMKKMVIYNTPSIFGAFINTLVKPYMRKKLFDRIIFETKGNEVLKEHLPVDILPCDIDPCGKAPSTKEIEDEWKRLLVSRRGYFEKAPTLATDERKRLPDSLHTHGVDGTFRMLSVD